jgi:nickel-dependent lactate racemase
MHLRIAYGKNGLEIILPDGRDITIVEPRYLPGLPDPSGAIRQALRAPIGAPALSEQVRTSDRVGIIFSDLTRPTPNQIIFPALLDELSHLPRENITLFNALGTHRPNTDAELRRMLGDALVDSYRIVQNNAFDQAALHYRGLTSFGHEVWVNRQLEACDFKILTGFIEPHLFAGFSGGGKAIMPGMAGQRTVLGNHGAQNIAHPHATWGVTSGNPIWEEIREVAVGSGRVFLLNVTLNKAKQITGVFAGDLDQAHAAGCAFVKETAMLPVPRPFDIVITTNSGYPLDLNLYQSVKGMSAASQIVRQGGAILIAAECWDGIPDHGLYRELLRQASSPQELLDRINTPGFLKQDQWQAQIQAQIQLKADVYVYSEYLTETQIREALLQPCRNIEQTLDRLLVNYGPGASICVLPEGPQTIPYIDLKEHPDGL